jgi:uncharacterized membrane protein YfcA
MPGEAVAVLLVWSAIGALVGYLIGKWKGRGTLGLWLGLLLGVIGWIIVAVLPDSQRVTGPSRRCPFCAEVVQPAAVVCKHCGRDIPLTRAADVTR